MAFYKNKSKDFKSVIINILGGTYTLKNRMKIMKTFILYNIFGALDTPEVHLWTVS